jgi:hypothetical protein
MVPTDNMDQSLFGISLKAFETKDQQVAYQSLSQMGFFILSMLIAWYVRHGRIVLRRIDSVWRRASSRQH